MPNRNRGPQDPAKPRVLVVDDEDDLLELVRYNLAKDGYDVECVGSGEQALRSARTNPPDLVVLDLMLPAVDGLEVCRRLKTDPKTRDILIVMLTAKGEEADMVAGLERGADDTNHGVWRSGRPQSTFTNSRFTPAVTKPRSWGSCSNSPTPSSRC